MNAARESKCARTAPALRYRRMAWREASASPRRTTGVPSRLISSCKSDPLGELSPGADGDGRAEGDPFGGRCGADLVALGDVDDRLVDGVRGVDERAEAAEALGVLERRGPLVLVVLYVGGHGRLELVGDAEGVLDDDLAHVLEPAVELLLPARGALEAVRGADVVHEVAVDVLDERFVVEVLREELGV